MEAVKQNGDALVCASAELQGDREFMMAAVKQDGLALGYASVELRDDREVVLAASKSERNRWAAMEHCSAAVKEEVEGMRFAEGSGTPPVRV